jgi:CIC family chloride channel protein
MASVTGRTSPNPGPSEASPSPAKGWRLFRRLLPFNAWVVHAPQTLRALVRADEIWLVVLAAVVGVVAGLCVCAMGGITQLAHVWLFDLGDFERLSGQVRVDPLRAILVPSLGGLMVGGVGWVILRYHPRRAIDPIEANALYGGRMSLNDSLLVVLQTLLSTGVGASVGLEAGYTQLGSAFASRLGRSFRLRRSDLRLIVGCGAAAAIACAFNAPLTGAFYAFELVIGTYSLANLAPVMAAALSAVAVGRLLNPEPFTFEVQIPSVILAADYLPIVALGVLCALGGIAIMRGVTLTEDIFRRSKVPAWLRPALGGLAVGGLALLSPQVLSSGHAGMQVSLDAPYALGHLTLLVVLKATASAISIGAGFRGGLFFASLFLGALVGKLFAAVLAWISVSAAVPAIVCALVGMSALAVAVVGGPLTMAFLALESTGSLPLTAAVVAASVVSSLTVRRTFGYSFATWRFHLRGEAIRSAVDVGWVRSLTVGRMMRSGVRTVRADMTMASFRRDFPLGSTTRAIVVDSADRYAGITFVPEAHAVDIDAGVRVGEILHHKQDFLLPQMTVKEAIEMFERSESDALAVVDGRDSKRVVGLLTEQHALRRYSEELDRQRRDLAGGE